MDPLVALMCLVAAVCGICAGAACSRDYARAFNRDQSKAWERARCAEAALEAYLAQPAVTQQPTPVAVHVHMPALSQGWMQPQVIDAQIVRELEERN